MGETDSKQGCCYYCRIVFVIWIAIWAALESGQTYFTPSLQLKLNEYFYQEYVLGNQYNETSKLTLMAEMNEEMDRLLWKDAPISPQRIFALEPRVEEGLKRAFPDKIPADYVVANQQILRKGLLRSVTKTKYSCHRDFSYGMQTNLRRLIVTIDPEGSCLEECEKAPNFIWREMHQCHTCETKCSPLVFTPYANFHKFGFGSHSIVIDYRPDTFIEWLRSEFFGAFLRFGHFLVNPLPLKDVKSYRLAGGRVFGRNRIRFPGLRFSS